MMEIKSISEKIFRTSPNKIENSSAHTNPFGVSFKGNIITADVFETKEKTGNLSFGQNLAKGVSGLKSRMEASAIVGSFNSMGQAFSAGMNSIANFGRTIKKNTAWAWSSTKDCLKRGMDYISENNLKIDLNIVNKKKDVSTLGKIFEEIVARRVALLNEGSEGIAV